MRKPAILSTLFIIPVFVLGSLASQMASELFLILPVMSLFFPRFG